MTNNDKHDININERWIRPLPERLVNKIAAGEVIERPSAVLKELVENAFDAGSTRIDILVEKSGTKEITVVDDGCGITHEQVEIAFARHATSKISNFDDLENLHSYGFRGEALPSIGSVSKIRMVTKSASEDTGTEIIIEGGVLQSVKRVSAPNGTRVEVRDLFFNTPARRKFLKAESTEARHLNRNAVALALGAPDMKMSYRINGRKLYDIDANMTPMERVARLLLNGATDQMFEISADSKFISVGGYLSVPEKIRNNRNGLFLFINNRFVSSFSMIHAVTSGYGELLPRGNYPVGAIFLNVDPLKVDVNVHPTKAEVRLSEERAMHDLLYQAVKRALRETGRILSFEFGKSENTTAPSMTVKEALNNLRNGKQPIDNQAIQTDLSKLYDKTSVSIDNKRNNSGIVINSEHEETAETSGQPGPYDEIAMLKRDAESSGLVYLGQLANLYLLFKTNNKLYIIDQHTAHERVLYEENLENITKGKAVSQNLLFPLNLELEPDRFALFEESQEILKSSGFEIEPFGGQTILISAVPTSFSKKAPESIFKTILEDIEGLYEAGFDLKKAVAQSMACRSAVMSGDSLTEDEAVGLVKRMLKCRDKNCCPHGRPTILKIEKDELDTRFGRK